MATQLTRRSIFSLKSWLFTPATKNTRFRRAAEVNADALIIDLEDAVAANQKAEARATALTYLEDAPDDSVTTALRINPIDTKHGIEDLHALLDSTAAPDYLIIPKCSSAAAVTIVSSLLKESNKPTQTIALIETARGLASAEEIASCQCVPAGLLFGAADMAADLGASAGWEPLLLARSRLVQAAALAGIALLDSPYFDISDDAGLRLESTRSAALGFHGKCAIHPNQIAAINEVFTPAEWEIEQARRVLAASLDGAGVLDGKMVDQAIAKQARIVLARAGLTE